MFAVVVNLVPSVIHTNIPGRQNDMDVRVVHGANYGWNRMDSMNIFQFISVIYFGMSQSVKQ